MMLNKSTNNAIKNLTSIVIKGDILHNDMYLFKNRIESNIDNNFFVSDLMASKKIFESIPWINNAEVKRVYPNQFEVKLSEYKPQAIWGAREEMRLVDDNGTIFEIEAEIEGYTKMPQLIGADAQSKLMLDMYKVISNILNLINQKVIILALNNRGSWIATLENGAKIELGRGNPEEISVRLNKFSLGVVQVLNNLKKTSIDIQHIDLRHSDGYAMRVNGVTTIESAALNTSLKK
jgi:cell division protein FtsQ